MRARISRWLRRALSFLCESDAGYYYTGVPSDPRWENERR